MEAECTASAQAVTGALWKLLWDFETRAIKVFSDEQGAIKSLEDPIASAGQSIWM